MFNLEKGTGPIWNLQMYKTITPIEITGDRTINNSLGMVNFAPGEQTLVVTNNLVTSSSVILLTIASNDPDFSDVKYVATNGSFTIYAGSPPVNLTRVGFLVLN